MWPASFLGAALRDPRYAAPRGSAAPPMPKDPDVYEKGLRLLRRSSNWRRTGRRLSAALAAGRAGAARHPLRRRFRARRPAFVGSGARSTAGPASQWREEKCRNPSQSLKAVPTFTSCGASLYLASTITARLRRFGARRRSSGDSEQPHQPRPARLARIVAKQAILAAGTRLNGRSYSAAMIRPASCLPALKVRTYVNRFGVAPGREAAIFHGWRRRLEYSARSGGGGRVKIVAVVDSREQINPSLLRFMREFRRAPSFEAPASLARRAATILAAHCDPRGKRRRQRRWLQRPARCFQRLEIRQSTSPRITDIVRFGIPRSQPLSQEICLTDCASPAARPVAFPSAGRLQDGSRLGAEAAQDCGFTTKQSEPAPSADPEAVAVAPVWRVAGSRGKAFVD